MAKRTFQRRFRKEKLTADEAARDDEVRRKVELEFPPLESKPNSRILSEPLRHAIAQSRKSIEKLAGEASISPVILTQFMAGQRDLRLTTAEKLASLLGLKLVAS